MTALVTEPLLDVTRLVERALRGKLPTGVDRVALAYVAHYRDRARALVRFAGRWVVLGRGDSRRLFDALLVPADGFARRVVWWVGYAFVLSWGLPRGSVLINAGHSGLHEPGYAATVRRFDLRALFFLHDLIPITHAEYVRPGDADKHRLRLETMLSVGRALVLNSRDTQREVTAHAAGLGLPVPPCMVVPLAPPELPPPAKARPLRSPYFVVLGTIEPRKNHLLLLHVWRTLVSELGHAAPRLVVIGQKGWECEQVVDLLERCTALRGAVIERQRCSDAELSSWLGHAQALLFPSFAEGFGIPLVEALAMGTPVVASNLPVFQEIAGGVPDYLDPIDGAGWREAILDYARPDSPRRAAQIERMAGFQAPTWQAHFERVEALVSSALD